MSEFRKRFPLTILEVMHNLVYPYVDTMIAVGRQKIALDSDRKKAGIPSIFD